MIPCCFYFAKKGDVYLVWKETTAGKRVPKRVGKTEVKGLPTLLAKGKNMLGAPIPVPRHGVCPVIFVHAVALAACPAPEVSE